jgi:hypothetical protein
MECLENFDKPLVYPVRGLSPQWRPLSANYSKGEQNYRTLARALSGMQKEAIVSRPNGSGWRMVCDEGPYLNGTDLAPFPLGFFCAGMVAAYMSEVLELFEEFKLPWRRLKLVQENRYAIEGSALKGTMMGSALPVTLQLSVDTTASRATIDELLQLGLLRSPVYHLLNDSLNNSFGLSHNGQNLPVKKLLQFDSDSLPLPTLFAELAPAHTDFNPNIIEKTFSIDRQEGVIGGVASSLEPTQKRELHMRGTCVLDAQESAQIKDADKPLQYINVRLFQPRGSEFSFVAESLYSSKERAPTGLDYLNAGIAFCFLTQAGRYASICKQDLEDYRLLQDFNYSPGGKEDYGRTSPLLTKLWLNSCASDEFATQLLTMSEQTCFLHGACRQQVPVECLPLKRVIPYIP